MMPSDGGLDRISQTSMKKSQVIVCILNPCLTYSKWRNYYLPEYFYYFVKSPHSKAWRLKKHSELNAHCLSLDEISYI